MATNTNNEARVFSTAHHAIQVQGVPVIAVAFGGVGEDGKRLKTKCQRTGRAVSNVYQVGTEDKHIWVSQGVLLAWGLTQPQVDKLYNTGYNVLQAEAKGTAVGGAPRITKSQLAADDISSFINA